MARLTIEFPDSLSEVLSDLAEVNQTTKREILRRALVLYKYLYEQDLQGNERKLSITDREDRILKDVVF